VDPASRSDYDRLLRALGDQGKTIGGIVHALAAAPPRSAEPTPESVAESLSRGYYSLLYLSHLSFSHENTLGLDMPHWADQRPRILPLERTGEVIVAPPAFMLVVSYNPGYQNILKALKPSTKQRFLAIEFDFLPRHQEIVLVSTESGLDEARVAPLVELAQRLRALKGVDVEEGVSTRLLVYCASLIDSGMDVRQAVRAAMIEPLTDDADVRNALIEVANAVIA
jgi:hypothetical protein